MELTRRGFGAWSCIVVAGINAGCVGSSGEQTGNEQQNGDASYETTSIVVAKSGDEAAQTAQVPVKWKRQADKAEKVNRQVQKKYGDLDGVRIIGIVNSPETIGEYHYSAIQVEVAPGKVDQVDEKVPDKIDNVSVRVVQSEGTVVPL